MTSESSPASPSGTGVERFFFALVPPRSLAFAITAWAGESLGPEWPLQQAERLHITLAITQDFRRPPSDLIERLIRAGSRVTASPVLVELDRLSISNRSACLRPSHASRDMKMLQQGIARAMAETGVAMRETWKFSPHLTLGYKDGRPSQSAVERRYWLAEELVLIRSLVGRTRHVPLGRWPLRTIAPAQYELF